MDMVWNGYSWNYMEPNYIAHGDNECELLVYCFRTPAFVHLDGMDYPVEYGDMLLMPKGKAHKIDSDMGYLTLDWLEIRMTVQTMSFCNISISRPESFCICEISRSLSICFCALR